MGMRLTLVPEKNRSHRTDNNDPPLAYERLRMDISHYVMWDELVKNSTPLTSGLYWYEEDGMKLRTTNPFGEPIVYVTAYRFKKIWYQFRGDESSTAWDQGVANLIGRLPNGTRIFLWFH